MATLIKSNGNKIENFNHKGLEAKQKAVGGYIEVVYTHKYVIYVNEDGINKRLPLNLEVSALVGRYILGDALVMTHKESREEDEE